MDKELELDGYFLTLKGLKKIVKNMEQEAIALGVPAAHVDNLIIRDSNYSPIRELKYKVAKKEDEHRHLECKEHLKRFAMRDLFREIDKGDQRHGCIAVLNIRDGFVFSKK